MDTIVSSRINQEKGNTIDFKTFLNKLISSWWIFLLSMALGLGISFIMIRYLTPKYKISAKLLVEEHKGQSTTNSSDKYSEMSWLINLKSNVDNEVEVLKTRLLAEKAVRGLDLNISYYRKGTFNKVQLYKSPFKFEILKPNDSIYTTAIDILEIDDNSFEIHYNDETKDDEVKIRYKYGMPFYIDQIGSVQIKRNKEEPITKDYKYKIIVNSVDESIFNLQEAMSISVTNKSVTSIDINMTHPVPKLGEDILAKYIEGYLNKNIADINSIADSTIHFIEKRLLWVSQELGDIEGNIQNFKQTNRLADISEQSKILVSTTNDYSTDLSRIETQIRILNDLESYLQNKSKNVRAIPNSAIPEDAVFNRLVENYNAMLLERDRQLLTSTESNPFIKNLDERISSLRNSMISSLASTERSLAISRDELKKKMNTLENDIRNVPAHERAYLGMFRQQTLKQELYLYLLKKREEIALTKTSNISTSKVIDFPKANSLPSSPNKLVILLVGLIAGFMLPLGFFYAQDLLNTRVRSKDDITGITNVPILGELSSCKKNLAYINGNPNSIIAEQFRSLKTTLHFYGLNNQKNFSILITSGMAGEGKTFTTLNLASVLAASGKKVVVIDLNKNDVGLSSKLMVSDKPGLSDYYSSPSLSQINIQYPTDWQENISVVPAGTLPMEQFSLVSDKMDNLMAKLKTEYDYLIFDAPHIGVFAEAPLFAQQVDLTLYLVRHDFTYKSQLNVLDELYNNKKILKTGILFNGIKLSKEQASGYNRGNNKRSFWHKFS